MAFLYRTARSVNAEGLESLSIWDEIALNQVVYDFIFEKPKF